MKTNALSKKPKEELKYTEGDTTELGSLVHFLSRGGKILV